MSAALLLSASTLFHFLGRWPDVRLALGPDCARIPSSWGTCRWPLPFNAQRGSHHGPQREVQMFSRRFLGAAVAALIVAGAFASSAMADAAPPSLQEGGSTGFWFPVDFAGYTSTCT